MSNHGDNKISEAQSLSWLGGLNPKNLIRYFGEKFFEDFKSKMEILRTCDSDMRQIALGRNRAGVPLKSTLGLIDKALKNKKYIDVAYYSYVINDIASEVIARGKQDYEQIKFLGTELLSKTDTLTSDEPDFLPQENVEEQKKKEAQVLKNIYKTFFGDPLERSYQAEIAKRKAAVEKMVSVSDNFVSLMLSSFDKMGIALRAGKIDSWISEFEKLAKAQIQYKRFIDGVYFSYIKDLVQVARKVNKLNEIASKDALQGLGETPGPEEKTVVSVPESQLNKEQTEYVPIELAVKPSYEKQNVVQNTTVDPAMVSKEIDLPELSEELIEEVTGISKPDAQTIDDVLTQVVKEDVSQGEVQNTAGDTLALVQDGSVFFSSVDPDLVVKKDQVIPLINHIEFTHGVSANPNKVVVKLLSERADQPKQLKSKETTPAVEVSPKEDNTKKYIKKTKQISEVKKENQPTEQKESLTPKVEPSESKQKQKRIIKSKPKEETKQEIKQEVKEPEKEDIKIEHILDSGMKVLISSSFIDKYKKDSDVSVSVDNIVNTDNVLVMYDQGIFTGEQVLAFEEAFGSILSKKVVAVLANQEDVSLEINKFKKNELNFYFNGEKPTKKDVSFVSPKKEEKAENKTRKDFIKEEIERQKQKPFESLPKYTKEQQEKEDREFEEALAEAGLGRSASKVDHLFIKIASDHFRKQYKEASDKGKKAIVLIDFSKAVDEISPILSSRLIISAKRLLNGK